MASAHAPPPPDGRAGADVLDLLAEAVLLRLDTMLGERAESLGPQVADRPEPGWLRVSEVAKRVGASERTVYRALRSGALAGERLGAHWRIRPASVEAWLAVPRPPRTAAIGPPARPAGTRATPGGAPPRTYMARARRRQSPQGTPAPTTSRGAAARKEQQ